MSSFISFQDLLKFGIPIITIKKGCSIYRKGRSNSWANTKDTSDKRKIWIDLDSIPNSTRNKYGVPTGLEYQEQQLLIAHDNKEIKRQKTKELTEDVNKEALYYAFTADWMPYYKRYQEKYAYYPTLKCYKIAKKTAQNHAFGLKC